MRRRLFILMAASMLAACSKPAAKAPPAPALPKRLPETGLDVPPDTVRVAIETSEGQIVLELDGKHAPQSTANFLHYVDTHKLDAGTFYRAIRAGPKTNMAGFIQFNSGDRTYPPIPHEPTTQTGLSHTDGALSTARYAVGTASNEFTICVGDMTYLDAGGTATPDKQGYAVLGHVVSGMDIVKRILKSRLKGENLVTPVIIISAHRIT